MDMRQKTRFACLAALLVSGVYLLPSCASAEWREGFVNEDTLQLVGEGNRRSDLSQMQNEAMGKEAAVTIALSHWQKLCPGFSSRTEGDVEDVRLTDGQVRIPGQKERFTQCDSGSCRARVIIRKKGLRKSCAG